VLRADDCLTSADKGEVQRLAAGGAGVGAGEDLADDAPVAVGVEAAEPDRWLAGDGVLHPHLPRHDVSLITRVSQGDPGTELIAVMHLRRQPGHGNHRT
jgi:hypothetical protein